MADNYDMFDIHMGRLVNTLGKLAACLDFLPAGYFKEQAINLLRDCRSETAELIDTYYQDKFTQIFYNGLHDKTAEFSGLKENDNDSDE